MLSRRQLRIKVMQVLYSSEIGHDFSSDLKKVLYQRIEKSKDLYFTFLLYLAEICAYSVTYISKQSAKHIHKQEDYHRYSFLANNSILSSIVESDVYIRLLKDRPLSNYVDKKIVQKLFKQLTVTQKITDHIHQERITFDDEKQILRYILRKIIGTSEDLDDHLSEDFMNYEDDHFISIHTLQKKIQECNSENKDKLVSQLFTFSKEDVDFAVNLINKYQEHQESFDEIIAPRLKNWDMDRVAAMDILLIKMAICELMYFPFIPIKVSINEYIDISKEYSTEKSKDFINGILDKVMNDLMEKGLIVKKGRGLIDS